MKHEVAAHPLSTHWKYAVSYSEGSGRGAAILSRMSRCGQYTYLVSISWVLLLQFLAIAAGSGAWQAQLALAVTGTVISANRLADAGYSRWLAVFATPTMAASWMFPAGFSGAPAMGLLGQFSNAIMTQNAAQFILALALLAIPALFALAPSKRIA